MDRFTQVEAFIAAVDHGSLAKAALHLAVTPAMLGRRIDVLEKRLGAKLLHRSTRRLVLTEQGSGFLEQSRRLMSEFMLAERAVSAQRHEATGHLIVSAPAAFGRKHVAPHAPTFQRKNPGVKISFNLTDRVADLVREGYELGIRIGGSIDPSFVAVKLADNHRVVCGTPGYFRRHGKPRALADLARHNCLAFNLQGGQQRGWYFQHEGKTVTIPIDGSLECNDGELLHRWVSEGIGIGWRSTWEIQGQLERGELSTVLDEFALPAYDILALYPQQRHLPARIRFFIEHLKATYASPGYWVKS